MQQPKFLKKKKRQRQVLQQQRKSKKKAKLTYLEVSVPQQYLTTLKNTISYHEHETGLNRHHIDTEYFDFAY